LNIFILIYIVHSLIRKFNKGQEDSEAVKSFITYNFEEQIRTHPGQRIVILFDMSETGLRHLVSSIFKVYFFFYSIVLHSGLWSC
jgi:hypothetical protein